MARLDRPAWTAAENERLCQYYPTTEFANLPPLFPGRNLNGIRQQASRLHLSNVRPRAAAWSEEHIAIMREHYPTKGAAYVAGLVGRTPSRVIGYASEHGIPFVGIRNPKPKTRKQYPAKRVVGRPRKHPSTLEAPALQVVAPVPRPVKRVRAKPVQAAPTPPAKRSLATPNLTAQKNAVATARKAEAEKKVLQAVVPAAEIQRLPYTHPARMAYMLNAKHGGAAANQAYHEAMRTLQQAA